MKCHNSPKGLPNAALSVRQSFYAFTEEIWALYIFFALKWYIDWCIITKRPGGDEGAFGLMDTYREV